MSRRSPYWPQKCPRCRAGNTSLAYKAARVKNTTHGFSLIELLIVVAIILIIAAVAIPNLLRSRMSANEAAAVSTLRNINNSQAAYIAMYGGNTGYANTMVKLGPGATCDFTHACLIDNVLSCASQPCIKGGYSYFLASSFSAVPFSDYVSTATPVQFGTTGQFNYCGTDDAVLRQEISPAGSLGAALAHDECMDASRFSPFNK
jgi:type IV pilus assembly protein PilA